MFNGRILKRRSANLVCQSVKIPFPKIAPGGSGGILDLGVVQIYCVAPGLSNWIKIRRLEFYKGAP